VAQQTLLRMHRGGEDLRPHRGWALVATQERSTSAQHVARLMHEFTDHCDPSGVRVVDGVHVRPTFA